MYYKDFLELLFFAVRDCGMGCGVEDNEGWISLKPNDDAWFICPECGEPIYYCDWKDKEVDRNCCPICETEYC